MRIHKTWCYYCWVSRRRYTLATNFTKEFLMHVLDVSLLQISFISSCCAQARVVVFSKWYPTTIIQPILCSYFDRKFHFFETLQYMYRDHRKIFHVNFWNNTKGTLTSSTSVLKMYSYSLTWIPTYFWTDINDIQQWRYR